MLMCIQIENRQYLIPFDDTHEKGKKTKPPNKNHFNKTTSTKENV